ncbi:MAG: S53 family peptidase [Steroidobacteraceae bacterium]
MQRISLKGSERAAMAGARVVSPADPAQRLQVSVIVRRRGSQSLRTRVAAAGSARRADHYLSREEFAQRHGADPADLAAIGGFAAAHGLAVVEEHAARRTVLLSGTVAQFEAAFAIQLRQMAHPGGNYRGRTGAISLPADLDGIIEAVLGLDDRPQAKPHFRIRAGAARGTSFPPTEIASLYGFPPGSGQGECVALIELGGGFRPADLAAYFSALGVGSPAVSAVSVDAAANSPTGNPDGPDGEVMLDIEVVGTIAPQARIAVYFAPNTDAGFLDAITTAIHDSGNAPSVISISWGGPESTWTGQAMTVMDEAFQSAAALGITVCVASGDNGSSDGVSGGGTQVDFPASSPFALACGGTSVQAAQGALTAEVVWNDGAAGGASGGGMSGFFAKPAWQAADVLVRAAGGRTPLSNRGVPDVAGDADPQTGYAVRIDGTDTVIGGTSAVAPLWAALIARINQGGKSAGYLNPLLYANPRALRDITRGNNGAYEAAPGWDACTGLGSPNGPLLPGVVRPA